MVVPESRTVMSCVTLALSYCHCFLRKFVVCIFTACKADKDWTDKCKCSCPKPDSPITRKRCPIMRTMCPGKQTSIAFWLLNALEELPVISIKELLHDIIPWINLYMKNRWIIHLVFSASCTEEIYVSYSSTNSHFNECFNAMKSELSIAPRCCTKNGDSFRIYSRKKYGCICRCRDRNVG